MKTSSKIALATAAALILALAGFLLSRQPTLSDQDQITAQLESARAAAQSHNVSGMMAIVSADFKGPEPVTNVDQLHLLLHRTIGKSGPIQVTLSPPTVIFQGDTATSTSQVTVQGLEANQGPTSQPLTLSWRREDGHRYLVFPIKVWRVVGAQYSGGFSGGD